LAKNGNGNVMKQFELKLLEVLTKILMVPPIQLTVRGSRDKAKVAAAHEVDQSVAEQSPGLVRENILGLASKINAAIKEVAESLGVTVFSLRFVYNGLGCGDMEVRLRWPEIERRKNGPEKK